MAEAKKGRGCFFYGCLTLAGLAVLAIISIYIGARIFAKHALNTWTGTNGLAIAPITLSRNQGNAVQQKIDDFLAALKAGKSTGPIELSSDELDYLIRNSEGWAHMRDHVHVSVTNSHVQGEISFPLEAIHPSMKGRFLNATAELIPKVVNGALVVDLNSVRAKGQKVPDKMLDGFRQNMSWKPDGAALESIEVLDNSVIITPKKTAPQPPDKTP